jgi:hypothetical protein
MRSLSMILTPLLAAATLAAAPTVAAEKLGIAGEVEVTTKGKVVDVACELTRDCPAQCGAGRRQLGIKTDDGKLLLAAKNAVNFMGSSRELLPYCGEEIWVDGVTTTNFGTTLLMVQRYRISEKVQWRDATQSLLDWAKANKVNPDSPQAEEWMRNDPLVKKAVAKRGKTGVGE